MKMLLMLLKLLLKCGMLKIKKWIKHQLKEVKLNIYRPNRVKTLELIHYDENDKELDKTELDENTEGIDLKSYNHDYYVLSTIYNNKKEEKMKLFVYPKNRIPTEAN